VANPYFKFKMFTVFHDRCAMKVTTDACLFGAWCAEEIKHSSRKNYSLLDIGTGTGLLSLMIAQKNNCIINAIEIDKSAAQQATENIEASPWNERISVHQKNILQHSGKEYSVIVSNPPFYENELQSTDERKNEAHHGAGLTFNELFSYLEKHLLTNGNFYLLLPYKRIEEAEKIIREKGLFVEKKVIVSTSPNHKPFRVMIKGGKKESTKEEVCLYINNGEKEYSNEFIQLLKDYYLYL
jgi:tRNA1Val (adenine37-N6)-methyltransferase